MTGTFASCTPGRFANGWDLFKALGLLAHSNATILEWLHSPVVYRESDLAAELRRWAAANVSPRRLAHHYRSLAKSTWHGSVAGRDTVPLKKYLYVLRPLLCLRWVKQHQTPPPTALSAVRTGIDPPPSGVSARLDDLLTRKKSANERDAGPPDALLDQFIAHELQAADQLLTSLPDPAAREDHLNEIAQKLLLGQQVPKVDA